MILSATQFVRTSLGNQARQKEVTTEIRDDLKEKVELMRKLNCRLTVEVLTTGEVSSCIEHPLGDIDCSVTPNGPEVQRGIEKMLENLTEESVQEFQAVMNAEHGDED